MATTKILTLTSSIALASFSSTTAQFPTAAPTAFFPSAPFPSASFPTNVIVDEEIEDDDFVGDDDIVEEEEEEEEEASEPTSEPEDEMFEPTGAPIGLEETPPPDPCEAVLDDAIECLATNQCFGYGGSRRLGEQKQNFDGKILNLDYNIHQQSRGLHEAACSELYSAYCNDIVTVTEGCDPCVEAFEASYQCRIDNDVHGAAQCTEKPDGAEGCLAVNPCVKECETSCRTTNDCSALPVNDLSCAGFAHYYCFTQLDCPACSTDTEACYQCRLEKDELYMECALPDTCSRYESEYGCWIFADEEKCISGVSPVYVSDELCYWDEEQHLCTEPPTPDEDVVGKKSGGKKGKKGPEAPEGKKGTKVPEGKKGGKKDNKVSGKKSIVERRRR